MVISCQGMFCASIEINSFFCHYQAWFKVTANHFSFVLSSLFCLYAKELSEKMSESRSGKQCRTRWLNHLDPSISKLPWTAEEEEIITIVQARVGNRWAEIGE